LIVAVVVVAVGVATRVHGAAAIIARVKIVADIMTYLLLFFLALRLFCLISTCFIFPPVFVAEGKVADRKEPLTNLFSRHRRGTIKM
jgi:hypothetical protein